MELKKLSSLILALTLLASMTAQARARSTDDPALKQGLSRGAKTEAVSLDAEAPGCPCKDQDRSKMQEFTAAAPAGTSQPGAVPKGPGNAEKGN